MGTRITGRIATILWRTGIRRSRIWPFRRCRRWSSGFRRCNSLADRGTARLPRNPQACILADVYHLYKGGSGFQGLKLLSKNAMHVIHLNDYPASPSRDKINDADRVYPGDGVAPLQQIFWDLNQIGFRGMLSIELFNRSYWEANAERVLETALAKLRVQVKKSFVTPVGG